MCPGKFSNMVLQALIALVKKVPPKGKRLLVIGTSSRKDVLDQMGLLSAFNSSLHLSNLTSGQEIVTVIKVRKHVCMYVCMCHVSRYPCIQSMQPLERETPTQFVCICPGIQSMQPLETPTNTPPLSLIRD